MFRYEGSPIQQRRLANHEDHCTSTGVTYDLRELVQDGFLMEPGKSGLRLTVGRSVGKRNRVLIYAVSETHQMRVGFDTARGKRDAVKHETLHHNADVRAAGELEVDRGIIVEVGDVSGSYGTSGRIQTDPEFVKAVLTSIDGVGARIRSAERRRLTRRARE